MHSAVGPSRPMLVLCSLLKQIDRAKSQVLNKLAEIKKTVIAPTQVRRATPTIWDPQQEPARIYHCETDTADEFASFMNIDWVTETLTGLEHTTDNIHRRVDVCLGVFETA